MFAGQGCALGDFEADDGEAPHDFPAALNTFLAQSGFPVPPAVVTERDSYEGYCDDDKHDCCQTNARADGGRNDAIPG